MRQRISTACTDEAAMPRHPAICTGPSRFRRRRVTIRGTSCGLVRFGLERGRELRSAMQAAPSVRYRSARFRAVWARP